jgi:MOSC domain-containing protein
VDDLVVTRLSTTPIKGMRLHHPDHIVLDEAGAVGDRDFVLASDDDRLVSITGCGELVDLTATWDAGAGRLTVTSGDGTACEGLVELGESVRVNFFNYEERAGRVVHGPWSEVISLVAARPLRLVKMDRAGSGSDVKPVTLLGEASVRALERESGLGPIDPQRFRLLIQFRSETSHVEDTWEGLEVEVGTARIRVGGSVPRCAAVTRNPEDGRRDKPIVKAIRAYRGVQDTGFGKGVPFGVYADVVQNGVVRVDDAVRVVATGDRVKPGGPRKG